MRSLLASVRVRRLLLSGAGGLLLLLLGSAATLAAGVVDQEQGTASAAACNEPKPIYAQTFTAGVSGALDAIDVYEDRLHAGTYKITAVDRNGLPTGPALASGPAPIHSSGWSRITLGTPVAV